MKKFLRQGDIQIARIENLPHGVKPLPEYRVESETSGNVHYLIGKDVEIYTGGSDAYAACPKGAVLVHTHREMLNEIKKQDRMLPEELHAFVKERGLVRDHEPIVLQPGVYVFSRHQLYDPLEGLYQVVID
ncbi:MAG: hypothetical protein KatS3mg031_2978 [Chitinophagales bacterium]|nr:MAG: hypothetical protein KatS3mg031_2978 [Chitinophagales bacterium]